MTTNNDGVISMQSTTIERIIEVVDLDNNHGLTFSGAANKIQYVNRTQQCEEPKKLKRASQSENTVPNTSHHNSSYQLFQIIIQHTQQTQFKQLCYRTILPTSL